MKTFKLSLFVIGLLLLIICPKNIDALSYISDYINLEDTVELETENFIFDLEYTKFSDSMEDKSSSITGYAVKKIDPMYYYHYVIYYYNANKEEIGVKDGYNVLWNKSLNRPNAINGTYFNSYLETKDMKAGYNLSSIKYYKFFIEETDKDTAYSYIYNGNIKINPNGIDPIKDNNTTTIYPHKKIDNDNYIDSTIPNTSTNELPSQNHQYLGYDYVIDSYDIVMVVNENNTFDITEHIQAHFNKPKHGIIRNIPIRNTVTRLDGTESKNRAQLSNLHVNNKYKFTKENGNYKIQIGDADKTITGTQEYTITYTYNLGKDPVKDYDEIYYNIIGDQWDTIIGNITFTIKMPLEFDESKIGFSSGKKGSTDNRFIKYDVDGKTITGSFNGVLEKNSALTIRCELPEGYFKNASLEPDNAVYFAIFIPIIFLLVAILLWYKYGKDDMVIETVEFYPPKGLNSLDVGMIYNESASQKDVTSLLIYLANKGYLSIKETNTKTFLSKMVSDFEITKLKEYDGDNPNEYLFMEGLFKPRKTIDLNKVKSLRAEAILNKQKMSYAEAIEKSTDSNTPLTSVTSKDLYDNFYITMNKIIAQENGKEHRGKYYENTSFKKSFIALMILLSYIAITIPPIYNYGDMSLVMPSLVFPGIGFTFMIAFSTCKDPNMEINGKPSGSKIASVFFAIFFGLLFGGMPWFFLVFPCLTPDPAYLFAYILGLISIAGMILCIRFLNKKTPLGNELFGKIKGFRTFLETAEKDRLESMVQENPTYFYDILPYTYVLGVSDTWIKKFETINIQAPSWYDSPNTFNVVTFSSFMNTTMSDAASVMSSSPSSGSGGSGGGSSGGGSGGGGGSSW